MNKDVLSKLSYGVYAIAAFDSNLPYGCIVNCAFQITNDCVLISTNKDNFTTSVLLKNKKFSLSILSEKIHSNIIAILGFSTGANRNKFEKVPYIVLDDVPIIKDSIGYLILETIKTVEVEQYILFIAKIKDGDILTDENPLTYKYYKEKFKGKVPKKAPTFVEQQIKKQYRCKNCGYIYNGDILSAPINFMCPSCNSKKNDFEEVVVV